MIMMVEYNILCKRLIKVGLIFVPLNMLYRLSLSFNDPPHLPMVAMPLELQQSAMSGQSMMHQRASPLLVEGPPTPGGAV